MKKIFLLAVILLPYAMTAQYHLDIEGYKRIKGNPEISHHLDTSSLYLGSLAAMNIDTNSLISPRYNTFIGLRLGQLSNTGNYNTSVGALSARSNEGFFNAFFVYEAGSKITRVATHFLDSKPEGTMSTERQILYWSW